MSKRKRSGESKHKAINAALGQLGWHASGKDVVALLANYGVEVNEGLVNKVRVDGLKKSGKARRLRAQARIPDLRRGQMTVRKVPQQRTYQR